MSPKVKRSLVYKCYGREPVVVHSDCPLRLITSPGSDGNSLCGLLVDYLPNALDNEFADLSAFVNCVFRDVLVHTCPGGKVCLDNVTTGSACKFLLKEEC